MSGALLGQMIAKASQAIDVYRERRATRNPETYIAEHSSKGDVKRLIRQKAEAATGRKMSNKAAKKWLKRYRPNFGKI